VNTKKLLFQEAEAFVSVLTSAAVSLLERGTSIIVATTDSDGRPFACRAWAVDVVDEGIRVLMPSDETIAFANLTETRRYALNACDVRTLESVQVKGVLVRIEEESAADRRRAGRHVDEFAHEIHDTDGFDEGVIKRMVHSEYVPVVLTVEELWDQTPGPNAGSAITV